MRDIFLRIQGEEPGTLRIQFEDGDGKTLPETVAISAEELAAFDRLRDAPNDKQREKCADHLHALLQGAPVAWSRLDRYLPRKPDDLPPAVRLLVEACDALALRIPVELLSRDTPLGPTPPYTAMDRWQIDRFAPIAPPSAEPPDRKPATLVVVGSTTQSLNRKSARPPVLDMLRELAAIAGISVAIPVHELRILRDLTGRDANDRRVAELLADASRCRSLASVEALTDLLKASVPDGDGDARPFDVVVLLGHSIEDAREATHFDLGLPRDGGRPPGPGFEEIRDALAHGETRLVVVLACLVGPRAPLALLRSVDHVIATSARVTADDAAAALGKLRETLFVEREPLDHVVPPMRRAFQGGQGWMLVHSTRTQSCRVLADPLALGLRQYLDGVIDDCERDLKDSLVGGRLDLLVQEAIALRDDDPGAREEFARRRAQRGAGGDPLIEPTTLRRRIELLQLDPGPRYLVVLGRPGGGKSVLLQNLAHELAKTRPTEQIPVLLRLRELADDDARSADLLKQALGKQRGCRADVIAETDPALIALRRAVKHGRALFLLDGVDELPPTRRDAFLSLARALGAEGHCTVVLTSRPIGFTCPTGFREIWLQPLDADRQRELVNKRHGADADRIWAALEPRFKTSPSLEHLAATPLFLTLLSDLAKEGEEIKTRELDVLEHILEFLVERRNQPESPRSSLQFKRSDQVLAVLRSLALAMTKARKAVWGEGEIRTWARSSECPADAEAALRTSGDWGSGGWIDFLVELARRSGILVARGAIGRRSFEFRHRAFQEALCARAVIEQHPQLDLAQVRALIDAAEGAEAEDLVNFWAEPLGLLAAEVRAPDEWILGLVAEKHTKPIALRALASARQLGDDTVLHVVELLGTWEERVTVYDHLLERVDRKRVLALVAKLCARTTNGVDLWHLRDLCVRLARTGIAGANELRARLFAHLAAPPRRAFSRIPRRSWFRRREPLWKLCPAGRFRMGENDDTVEVSIPAPFWIMAVTITAGMYRCFDPGKRHQWGEELCLPQTEVTWFEADAFCAWLNSHRDEVISANPELAGSPAEYVFRLPDEAEWEYACRASTTTAFWSGDEPRDPRTGQWIAWFDGNPATKGRVHPVGSLAPNPWGLHDMHGNVDEWGLEESVERALRVLSSGSWQRRVFWDRDRVLRGGSYRDRRGGLLLRRPRLESTVLDCVSPDDARGFHGFRLVLSAPELASGIEA